MRYLTIQSCSIVLECLTATDCPNGGTNFVCNANICVLYDEKCGGMLILLGKLSKF